MAKATVTIRGLDMGLLKIAKTNAEVRGKTLAVWLNDAIMDKLHQEESEINELKEVVKETTTKGVFEVPFGTVKVGLDYSVDGISICAAGKKGNKEIVSYSPIKIHEMGYQIFWIR